MAQSMEITQLSPEPEVMSCEVRCKKVFKTNSPLNTLLNTEMEPKAGPSTPMVQNDNEDESNIPDSSVVVIEAIQVVREELETNALKSTTINKRFSSLLQNATTNKTPRSVKEFYPDCKITPFEEAPGVYQILTSGIGLQNSNVSWQYHLLSHGFQSHTWSLIPAMKYDPRAPLLADAPVHPIALLETMGKNIALGEARITDLQLVWEANTIDLQHYRDSFNQNGTHISFQIEEGYKYEWLMNSVPDHTGTKPLELWRIKTDSNSKEIRQIVAKVSEDLIIKNPCDGSKLWCVEVMSNAVPSHIALLSAFSIKACHSKISSWWARRREPEIYPARPLVNFSFEDDGRILARSNKFWGDWEEEAQQNEAGHDGESTSYHNPPITVIKVFSPLYLRKYMLSPPVLNLINHNINHRVKEIKRSYSIE